MKKTFQIFRPLKFSSTLLSIAFVVLAWGNVKAEYRHDVSNIIALTHGDTNIGSSTFQDKVFAILPPTSKVLTLDFYCISNFYQVKLLMVGNSIDAAVSKSANFLVRNIYHILTSINAP